MTGSALRLPLRSVNVGLPAIIGEAHGKPVLSGIRKAPARGDSLHLAKTNLAGDGQADLQNHGGPDKAVYAYSTLHWPAWRTEYGLLAQPGSFGENLTVDHADETQICIGDVFAWGGARLAVSQPRQPCYKLAMMLGRADIGAAMVASGRCGFYLRVLQGGEVPLKAASLERIETQGGAPSVHVLFKALFDTKLPAETLERLAATPDLAAAWVHALRIRAASRRT